ncbi:hypothetical protein JCM19239_6541 [Vibrio variabilis]|uniref:Uncharacterized protein n=1 Tax=Vibrio variabilis TaxID=990271 RepID=A0ABQ0JRH2_9VIBR|nr:hypothetical protein JCM19239_6541 [Vibrio variabilis]
MRKQHNDSPINRIYSDNGIRIFVACRVDARQQQLDVKVRVDQEQQRERNTSL